MSVRFFVSAAAGDRPLTLVVPRTALVALLASLFPPLAAAQPAAYPSKTIRMIASQAPGGGIDYVRLGCRAREKQHAPRLERILYLLGDSHLINRARRADDDRLLAPQENAQAFLLDRE